MRAMLGSRLARVLLSGLFATVAVLADGVNGVAMAEVQPSTGPQAEVLVIHGTTCAVSNVDPQIGEIPPLKHNCWKLLEKKFFPLAQGVPSTMALPNGRTFQVTYGGLSADKRFKVAAAISKPDGTGFNPLAEITAEPGKKFHVGGFAYQNGSLVLAIRIAP